MNERLGIGQVAPDAAYVDAGVGKNAAPTASK